MSGVVGVRDRRGERCWECESRGEEREEAVRATREGASKPSTHARFMRADRSDERIDDIPHVGVGALPCPEQSQVARDALAIGHALQDAVASAPTASQEVRRGQHNLHEEAVATCEVEAGPQMLEAVALDADYEAVRVKGEVEAFQEAVPSHHRCTGSLRQEEHTLEGCGIEAREPCRARARSARIYDASAKEARRRSIVDERAVSHDNGRVPCAAQRRSCRHESQ